MYKENPNYVVPGNNPKIWHYVRYGDFLKIIEKNALYFRRMDLMQQSSTPEYTISKPTLRRYEENNLVAELIRRAKKLGDNGTFLSQRQIRENYFVNPWTMSNNANVRDLMYGAYAYNHQDEVVIMESTYDCLISSFMQNDSNEVYVGMVQYFDPKDQPLETVLQPSTHRPNEKEWEQELRAVTLNNGRESNISEILKLPQVADQCKEIQVSLSKLIKKVYVSPEFNKSLVHDLEKVVEDNIGKDVFSGVFP